MAQRPRYFGCDLAEWPRAHDGRGSGDVGRHYVLQRMDLHDREGVSDMKRWTVESHQGFC